jgi:ribonucleotide reductase alpha subunit
MLLIGYFLAEGHIAEDRSSITFTFGSKEISYIQETKQILEDIFDIKVNINKNRDNSTNVSVHSKIIGLFFDKLVGTGFDKKALNNDLLFANPKVQKWLLVGAIRGDGCALKEGYQLTMSNKNLIKQLFEISLRCGLSPFIKRDFRKHKWATIKASHLKIGVKNDKDFILSVNKNIDKINFNPNPNPKASSTLRYFWFKNEYFMKIIDREDKYLEDKVYNIEVEEDHSYSVSGVNVHNCYIGSTSDNIEGIFDAYKEMALLSKFGGGIGWDWSLVRGMGSFIDGHKNAAGGIIPFLKIANDVAIAVDQLGTRKGAIAVYIEPWHIDIKEFIDLKKNSGEERRRTHDLFPAIWLNDIFMQRVVEDSTWTLFDPYEVSELTNLYGEEFNQRYIELENDESITKEVIKAKSLWKEILRSYFETGNPFLTFKDTANRSNPNSHDGVIRSSNLCVTGDTRLHTQFGLVKAKDLESNYGEIVASYDQRTDGDISALGVSKAKALKMFKTKENSGIYEVTTKDGYSIKSTLWHEYFVANGENVEKKSLENISVGDKLLIQSDEGQFGIEGSYDLGFLMGIVAGDGTFSYKEAKKHSVVHIDLYNQDMKLGYKIQKQIENIISQEYSSLPNSHKEDFKNVYPKMIQHTKNSQKLRFSNIRLGRILDEIFNFNKESKHQVPEIIFKGTKEAVKGYLQGLFIADATVNKIENDKIPTFALQLASIQKSLLEEVQMLLSNFGIRSKISKMRDIEEGVFKYITVDEIEKSYDSKPLYRLNINGNNAIKFINTIGFIGAKQTRALEILAEREALGYSRESRKQEKFLVEISDIKYIGKEDVYDTTQLYNHSLIFNGLVTGNCTEIFQNTNPNTYKIQLTFSDETVAIFDENETIKMDDGIEKLAKKITALDMLDGKQIWMVDKEKTDGETAVCNLASVNLSKVNSADDIARVVPIAIRMLDNVIDLNFYPLAKVKKTNQRSRAIGLGVMGEAQMLAESQIHWGSDKHFMKIDEVMESISYYAIDSSSNLASEKGSYPTFKGSNWSNGILPIDTANKEALKLVDRIDLNYNWDDLRKKVKENGIRNGYLMAIAPTSSISILVGTTQAIEPVYKRKWFEENLSGLIPVVAPNLSPDTWNYYTPCYELDQRVLIKAGAIRQKWIDQGQSLNIFISLDKASGKYLNNIYSDAWKYGLKSTYYLRSQSPEAVQSTDGVEDRSQECVGCQ